VDCRLPVKDNGIFYCSLFLEAARYPFLDKIGAAMSYTQLRKYNTEQQKQKEIEKQCLHPIADADTIDNELKILIRHSRDFKYT